MKKIVKYDIIHSDEFNHFYEVMSQMIKDGWQPYGEFQLTHGKYGNIVYWLQPIVKYDENEQWLSREYVEKHYELKLPPKDRLFYDNVQKNMTDK